MSFVIKKVNAPLNISAMGNITDDIIYEFNYEKSEFDSNKPDNFITYIENIGCELDVLVSMDTKYEDKERLLLSYFNSTKYFKVLSFCETMIHILFTYKKISGSFKHSFFTKEDCKKFIDNNQHFISEITSFYDSLFIVMLLFSNHKGEKNSLEVIKSQYPITSISDKKLSPNIVSLLLSPLFYDYYKNGVDKSSCKTYYNHMLNVQRYGGESFLSILLNKDNFLIKILGSINDPLFQDFINRKYKSKKERSSWQLI